MYAEGAVEGGSVAAEVVEQWDLQARLADLTISQLLAPIPDLVEVTPPTSTDTPSPYLPCNSARYQKFQGHKDIYERLLFKILVMQSGKGGKGA